MFEPGDLVLITRKAHSREDGWGDIWVRDMDSAVGRIGVVASHPGNGQRRKVFLEAPYPYSFPDFVLTKVNVLAPVSPHPIKLPDFGYLLPALRNEVERS